jgi:predicted DsbA family dithiol-disulfide isomerase
MDGAEVTTLFQSDEGAGRVDEMAAKARESGVSGVPTIEINGHKIVGAEDASEFYETLVKAKEEQG